MSPPKGRSLSKGKKKLGWGHLKIFLRTIEPDELIFT
jgi:hypothetical protein